MRLKKTGLTLIELQMASILMIVVLVATGVIFYFALASIRYMHDAVIVYSNASQAMKVLTDEIMVSNCYGNAQGSNNFPIALRSFYDTQGYKHGSTTTFIPTVPAGPLSDQSAGDVLAFMPFYDQGTGSGGTYVDTGATDSGIYLRQVSQDRTNATIAGDFPNHDNVGIYVWTNGVTGVDELRLEVSDGAGPIMMNGGDFTVAHNIVEFQWQDIAYNCVAVRIRARGNIVDPFSADPNRPNVYEVTLAKMINLRCAPTIRPWED